MERNQAEQVRDKKKKYYTIRIDLKNSITPSSVITFAL